VAVTAEASVGRWLRCCRLSMRIGWWRYPSLPLVLVSVPCSWPRMCCMAVLQYPARDAMLHLLLHLVCRTAGAWDWDAKVDEFLTPGVRREP